MTMRTIVIKSSYTESPLVAIFFNLIKFLILYSKSFLKVNLHLYPGPCVSISKSRLIFHNLEEKGKITKRIIIANESIVPAIFLFDLDEKQCPFKLSLTNGTIKPSSFIYVYISFVPFTPGIHVYYLPCLILNHVRNR